MSNYILVYQFNQRIHNKQEEKLEDMNKFEVTVVGSTMTDLVTYADILPQKGETVLGNCFSKNFGGKGANQAVQSSLLGAKTCFISSIGNDMYGSDYLNHLKKEKIMTDFIKISSNKNTGIASIFVDKEGQNSIIIVPGANLDLNSSDIDNAKDIINNSNVLICQNEISFETTLAALKMASEQKTITIYNPAPIMSIEKTLKLLPYVDILCPNEVELAGMTNLPTSSDEEVKTAAEYLINSGYGNNIIVTLGSRGACLCTKKECIFFSADKVNAIDTVGAGDSFIGSFAANVSRGLDLKESIRKAISCSSISVTRKGAQSSYISAGEIFQSNNFSLLLPKIDNIFPKDKIYELINH